MNDRKAEYRPNPDPIWVRETMVEDYKSIADRNGVAPSAAEIEKIALEDLRIADAVDRDSVKPMPRNKPEQSAGPSERVTKLAGELGYEVVKKDINEAEVYKPRSNHYAFLSKHGNEKQRAIATRINFLMQSENPLNKRKEFDFIGRALAMDVVQLITDLKEWRGVFHGMSAKDCERIFWAKAQDICDRSTGKHGQWWVPK